jgi:hypothetical protein
MLGVVHGDAPSIGAASPPTLSFRRQHPRRDGSVSRRAPAPDRCRSYPATLVGTEILHCLLCHRAVLTTAGRSTSHSGAEEVVCRGFVHSPFPFGEDQNLDGVTRLLTVIEPRRTRWGYRGAGSPVGSGSIRRCCSVLMFDGGSWPGPKASCRLSVPWIPCGGDRHVVHRPRGASLTQAGAPGTEPFVSALLSGTHKEYLS